MLNYNKSKFKGVLGEFGEILYFILFSLISWTKKALRYLETSVIIH